MNSKKKNRKKKYNWPPEPEPYVPVERNAIHSVLTALPVIMLVAGLYFYYKAETEQIQSAPIQAESHSVSGIFKGLSVVKSGNAGRHYLWFDEAGTSRGVRVRPEQAESLQRLIRGEPVSLKIAPTVHESKIYWAWYVEQAGTVYLDSAASMQ
ncbi:MAG: hypothetical protein AB8B63_21990 [Granulosicoccus sp.]